MAIYDNQAKDKDKDKEAEVIASANEEAESNDLKIKLSDPVDFDGRTYEEINLFGLYNLTGKDYMACERYCRKIGGFDEGMDPMKEFSMPFIVACASRATGLPMEIFDRMSLRDLVLIKNAVVGFIYGEA